MAEDNNRRFRPRGRGNGRGRPNYIRPLMRPLIPPLMQNGFGAPRVRHPVGGAGRASGYAVRGHYNLGGRPPRPTYTIDENLVSFGYKQLKELSESEPTDIMKVFSQQTKKFSNFIANPVVGDFFFLFVKCLSKVCDVAFEGSKVLILLKTFSSPFGDNLCAYMTALPYVKIVDKKRNWLYWDNAEEFWSNLFKVYDCVMDLSPTVAYENLRKILDCNKLAIYSLEIHQLEVLPEDLKTRFNNLETKLATIVKEYLEKKKKDDENKPQEETEVPDDYRSIPVLPTEDELRKHVRPFLRPNIIDGAYKSLEHYLDVQFRLMREDYISPMRESIRDFIKNPHQRRYNGGRFYRNVRFNYFHISNNSVGITVSFAKKLTNIRSFYRRFLFGALVCFSEDNFNSIFFGTIVDRSDQLLRNGMIVVTFEDDVFDSRMFEKTYTMFESDVFYLQYGPVLKILKKYRTAIPMQRYIVNLEESRSLPEYIVANDNLITIDDVELDLRENNWPTADELHLNEFQYNAYKMALTRDFVAIQGPPGTGKTFLGLKIVKTLLSDPNVQESCTPIMVMCYTNHALDQFLEGLLVTTRKLVRIGGQSKNEQLANQYNLQKLRYKHRGGNAYKDQLVEIMQKLRAYQRACENAFDNDGITDVVLFEKYLPNFYSIKNQLSQFEALNRSRSYLVNWLMLADNLNELYGFSYGKNMNVVAPFDDEPTDADNPQLQQHNNNRVFTEDFLSDEDGDELESIKIKWFNTKSLQNSIMKVEVVFNSIKQPSTREQEMFNIEKNKLLCENIFLKEMTSQDYNIHHRNVYDYSMLTYVERWALYKLWNNDLCKILLNNMLKLKSKFDVMYKLYEEFNSVQDLEILQRADVVGLTTTAAARLNQLIHALQPKIVIIEEAAEVLESHIVVNLSPQCQHLILIGDHQQLRPSTSSYAIGKKFNLEISLFERVFKNEKNCCKLAVQHRMRPEISKLITPTIYPILFDHPSVESFPDVLGVTKNLYFIDHSIPEQEDNVINSKKNEHEAKFVISLAKYFIQQGYKPYEITILVTYSGQFFSIREHKKNVEQIEGVRCSVLDNFQGEENKIIILSLVRSNSENIIGFLETANRICVALSRAKEGFYIIGNMTVLKNKSEIWQHVYNTLVEQDSIGPHLSLRCQNHGVVTNVERSDDFFHVSEGGCNRLCNVLLKCGHYCLNLCHVYLNEHENYQCKQKCNRVCVNDHECRLPCFKKCECNELMEKDLPCGHKKMVPCYLDPIKAQCNVNVEVKLKCTHDITVKCFETKGKIQCIVRCFDRLPCGHACVKNCHVDNDPTHIEYECHEKCALLNRGCENEHPCEKMCYQECDDCTIMVLKKRTGCTHSNHIECFKNINETNCTKKCTRQMECGHFCKRSCWQECTECNVKVEKVRRCGHTLKVDCDKDANTVACVSRCNLMLECGHRCSDICGKPCGVAKCTEMVANPFDSHCGHKFDIPCHLTKTDCSDDYFLSQYCKNPCNAILKPCDHTCTGRCGECMGRLHVPCASPCGYKLICGHSCENPCREACDMCPKKCEAKCSHSRCSLKCGVPCIPCNVPCVKKCAHAKCNKKCGELCDIMPCDHPCLKKLKCGHDCIGLCGETCPDICRHCNSSEMPMEIFGNDYDEESRYVKLSDCGHLVEVQDMDAWIMSQTETSNEVAYPKCPFCNTLILNSNRYLNLIKKINSDIQRIKKKVYGNHKNNCELIEKIIKDVEFLKNDPETNEIFSKVERWGEYLHKISIEKELKRYSMNQRNNKNNKNKKNRFFLQMSKNDIDSFVIKIDILKQIKTIVSKMPETIKHANVVKELKFILNALRRSGKHFSEQQIDDLNRELTRFSHLCEVYNLYQDTSKFKTVLKSICIHLFYSKLSEDEWDKELKILFKQLPNEPDIKEVYKMVVKAMGFRQGHWYKCPNGHPYCIADCGGAMVVSTCPDCGAKVGGTNHALLRDNALASEVDGATHSAWSQAANDLLMIRGGMFNG